MSNEENINEHTKSESSLSGTDILSNLDGIPLPPVIKKNIWKSINRLITGLVDVPVSLLEAKVQKIKSESEALSLITKKASETVAEKFSKDEFLIERTTNYFGSKLLREQINRENTFQKAIDDLKLSPPKEDSEEEIDSDWLEMFSKIAETKSNEEVQLFLSKILAGEIRKPGTFSPKTIHTLSLLDQKTAKTFQLFCNISFEIPNSDDRMTALISEPFGAPGSNALRPVGLAYSDLTQLQDAGLIQHDLNAWKKMPSIVFSVPIKIGNTILNFDVNESLMTETITKDPEVIIANSPQISVINFTNVGLELRKVLHLSHNKIYNDKFIEWVKSKYNISQK